MSDTSKPKVDGTNSEVDVVKLLQAYGMVPTEGSELKHRKKVVADEISMAPIQSLNDVHSSDLAHKPLVLRGSPLEYSVNAIKWELSEELSPINSYITSHVIPVEMANPLNWSFDVHLIEIDDIHTDVVYSNVELNGVVLKGKQDTGAQINVLSTKVSKSLNSHNKLPLYLKTDVKLVCYGNKLINYLDTTKIQCNHNGTQVDAVFYVTDVPDTKIILGLQLCIDLGLIVIHCDNNCRCKNMQVAETSATSLIKNTQGADGHDSMVLPPVPPDMKIDETNPKSHIMQLYPDLFEGVGTIKDAVVHLDVKLDATPIVCSPRRMPDALRDDLKAELDRMGVHESYPKTGYN